MNERRTSGEIVNATLVEVFLTLSFVVFGLAVFEQMEGKSGRAGAANTRARDSVAIDSLSRVIDILGDSIRQASKTSDSLRFASDIPPNCAMGRPTEEWLTMTLAGPGRIQVRVNQDGFGYSAGSTLLLAPSAIATEFSAVRSFSIENGCRLPVRIVDTEQTSKEDYKAALAGVRSVFRLGRGFLR